MDDNSEAAKTNEGVSVLKIAKQFLRQQPPAQPAVPVSPPQSNSVRIVSEGSDPVSPTLSKAIEAYFVDE